ncbi:MAG: hypothetical protein IIT39_17610, partial [Clostridia bacterium]|nr:hypothetical protein [Clostridia bacterium]
MKNLSDKAKQIYDLLRNRPTTQDENGTYCIYPIKELAMNINIPIITAKRAFKELKEKNYISYNQQGNKAPKIYFDTANDTTNDTTNDTANDTTNDTTNDTANDTAN